MNNTRDLNIINALNNGFITRYTPNTESKEKIKNAMRQETKSFLLTTFGICIVSIIVLIILILIHSFILEKIGIVIIKYALFIIPGIGVLSPLYGIYDFFSKGKCIKNDTFDCFIGHISNKEENSENYFLKGLVNEKAEFLKNMKPQNQVQSNDKVVLIRIDGDNYLIDINQLNDASSIA